MARLYRHGQKLPVSFIRRGDKKLDPTIRGGKVVYVPRGGSGKPSKPLTASQKEKNAVRMAVLREKRKAAARIANERMRKVPHYRVEHGREVLLRNLPGDDDE